MTYKVGVNKNEAKNVIMIVLDSVSYDLQKNKMQSLFDAISTFFDEEGN